jgi:hypothetical protein
MRKTLALFGLALALASPALAQSNRGAFGLDAMVAPTSGLGFAYYVTDGLSLRPWLGLGYSDYDGFYASAGAQLRYEFAADGALSPYLSATAQYTRNGAVPTTPAGSSGTARYQQLTVESNAGQFGAGAGLRYRLSGSLALFGEGRVMYTTFATGSYGWSSVALNDNTRAEAVLGLTYLFR